MKLKFTERFYSYVPEEPKIQVDQNQLTIEEIREGMGGVSRDITTRPILIEDKMIQGYKQPIRVRIYRPQEINSRPLMMFFHGGGWIGGTVEAVDEYCKAVSDQVDCTVVSVDYSLAPEQPFPVGLEDSYLATLWAVKEFSHSELIVSGDSAGGNIATVLALLSKERKEFNISKQILIYPVTDLVERVSTIENKDEQKFVVKRTKMYLGEIEDLNHPLISPFWHEDLSRLPDTLIAVGDLDFVYKSSLAYGKKLAESGNTVWFSRYKNTRHAFIDHTGNCPQAADLIQEVSTFINKIDL